jgi:squalene-associated FAD-dependent desaturase
VRSTLAVIGAGWAGLATAVEATRAGFAVTVFDTAAAAGGRAREVTIDGLPLDNGQHILIGAYVQTLRLMRLVGVDIDRAFLRTPLRLTEPNGRGLHLPPGPPLIAFARGVLGRRGWKLTERIGLLAAATGWLLRGFRCDPSLSVAELTASLGAGVRADLIEPLCVAALNTPAGEASAAVFLRVLKDGLFSGPGSADLLLPRVSLGALFPQPALAWLQRAGAELRLGTRVMTLERAEHNGWSVDGRHFDHVIVATPPNEAARLTAALAPAWSAQAAALRYEPIVTVYARSAGTRLGEAMVALRSDEHHAPAQFVFDRGQLGGPPGLLAFVISGAAPWVERGIAATETATLTQARTSLGERLREPPEVLQTIVEKRATFRCTPGLARPPPSIAPGLWAVGDHVDGPYPATLEGAIRSAVAAVEALARRVA